jgi:RNA polymerase sigma factor (sigma-70 family)
MEVLGAAPTELWTERQLSMRLDHSTGQFTLGEERLKAIMSDALREQSTYALSAPSPEDNAISNELNATVEEILGGLTEREASVIRARFGIGDGNDKTREEIAEEFDVTAERIAQIEAKALRKMRHPARNEKISLFLDDPHLNARYDERKRVIRWRAALDLARKERAIARKGWKERFRHKVSKGEHLRGLST